MSTHLPVSSQKHNGSSDTSRSPALSALGPDLQCRSLLPGQSNGVHTPCICSILYCALPSQTCQLDCSGIAHQMAPRLRAAPVFRWNCPHCLLPKHQGISKQQHVRFGKIMRTTKQKSHPCLISLSLFFPPPPLSFPFSPSVTSESLLLVP